MKYEFNYYVQGRFYNGDEYHEVCASEEEAMQTLEDIKATDELWQKERIKSQESAVVQFSGLTIVKEVSLIK